jgi:hypothetical protein
MAGLNRSTDPSNRHERPAQLRQLRPTESGAAHDEPPRQATLGGSTRGAAATTSPRHHLNLGVGDLIPILVVAATVVVAVTTAPRAPHTFDALVHPMALTSGPAAGTAWHSL